MRNLKELEINEGGKPVTRPPPSVQMIQEFEHAYGIKLPHDLVSLLCFSNGGHPQLNAVNGRDGEFALDTFYHLTDENHETESLWYAMKHWLPALGTNAIPFGNDGGGNQFFIDLSTGKEEVKICLHNFGMKTKLVANSFSEFIDSLDVDPDLI